MHCLGCCLLQRWPGCLAERIWWQLCGGERPSRHPLASSAVQAKTYDQHPWIDLSIACQAKSPAFCIQLTTKPFANSSKILLNAACRCDLGAHIPLSKEVYQSWTRGIMQVAGIGEPCKHFHWRRQPSSMLACVSHQDHTCLHHVCTSLPITQLSTLSCHCSRALDLEEILGT